MKRSFVASENAGDSALGHLIWFSVGDIKITRQEIEDLATKANLPERFLPPQIRPVDAFRRATAEVGGAINEKEDFSETILVREVSSDKEGVTRHLVKETADKKNKRLSYAHCGTFNYDRDRESIFGTAYTEEVSPAVNKASVLFQKYKYYYTSDHIRRMVKVALAECQSVPLRTSGAVYFVPRKHEDKIRSLKDFVKCLPGENTEIHLMPVVDMEEQREMLEQKLRNHVTAEVSRIGSALGGSIEVLGVKHSLKEMAAQFARTLKENPEVSKSLVNSAVEHLHGLSVQVKEYENLLETNLSEVRSSIDIIRTQVKSMLNKVETENFFDLTVPVSA